MNTNQQACNLEPWQVQGKLEKHSSSFSWWDHPKNMSSRQEEELQNGIGTGWQEGLQEGGKTPERLSWKTQLYQDDKISDKITEIMTQRTRKPEKLIPL